ncbi:MAG: Rap1a/Tai family immunity protein [Sedimenticola sp.]
MIIVRLVVFTSLLISWSISSALTGNELLSYCESEDVSNEAACLSYIEGVIDTEATLSQIHSRLSHMCIPARGVTKGQVMRIVAKFLKDNPEGLHHAVSTDVLLSLSIVFPCEVTRDESNN